MTVYEYLTSEVVEIPETPSPVGVDTLPIGPIALGCFADMEGEARIMKEITTDLAMTREVGTKVEWVIAAVISTPFPVRV